MLNFFNKYSKKKKDNNFKNRDVLVGIVRNRNQYEVNLANRFYHIPAKRIYMLDFPINYVALFKSDRIFPESESGIFVYGKVKSVHRKKRYDITEIPSNSDEIYLRFEIEEWIYLKNPIEMCDISKTHMFTTMHLLLNARTVPELYSLNEPEFNFIRFLDEQCRISHIGLTKNTMYIYCGIKIGFTNEYIEVVYPNTMHIRFERSSYYKKPFSLLCEIKKLKS